MKRGETPKVYYEGVYLGGADTYGWDYISGVAPQDKTFLITRPRAEALRDKLGKQGVLTIEPDKLPENAEYLKTQTRTIKQYKKLTLLEILAGDDPFMARIRLSDVRWLWPKYWISSKLNWRRATGDTFVAGENRIENAVLPPSLQYAEWSLFPPHNPVQVWTAAQALGYYVTNVLNTPIRWQSGSSPNEDRQVEIQNLVLEGPGPAIVQHLLSEYLPGFQGYIDAEGVFVVYDDQSRQEEKILAKLPSPQTGGGQVVVSDKRALRPKKVVVHFTPEIEIRFDYLEGTSRTSDSPTLFNVAPSPDFLTGGTLRGSNFAISENPATDDVTAARGSYVALEHLFAAWGSFGFFQKPVSFDVLRKHATKYGFASFLQAWGNHPYEPFDGLKMARAQAAAQHWRRTFQIDEVYTQRLESINSYRVSLLVPHLGVYAPSPVYADWTRRPSYKGFATGGDPNDNQGFFVRSFPPDNLLDNSPGGPAPARVHIIDPGAGIFTIEPIPDPWGFTDNIWFGYPEDGFIPQQDIGKAKATAQMVYRHWFLVTLEPNWKLAVVLTVVPGSPNTNDRLWQVEVEPDAALGPCDGPVVYARVLPGVMTARFGWRDGTIGDALHAAILGNGPLPAEALVNEEWVKNVANAVAARIYEPLRDRPQGSLTVDWSPDVEPGGTIADVKHTMSGGVLETSLNFPAAEQARSIWPWLDPATRRVVLQIMEHPGSPG